ncbi:hypothetical protein O3M35_010500 [Rhynocoris fuscipes]|uniref:Uncharacterized protein n=1 Tax=Rhynocoris fuscipes TaxID=488301 RepID=A0AAW1CZ50_9HEMI
MDEERKEKKVTSKFTIDSLIGKCDNNRSSITTAAIISSTNTTTTTSSTTTTNDDNDSSDELIRDSAPPWPPSSRHHHHHHHHHSSSVTGQQQQQQQPVPPPHPHQLTPYLPLPLLYNSWLPFSPLLLHSDMVPYLPQQQSQVSPPQSLNTNTNSDDSRSESTSPLTPHDLTTKSPQGMFRLYFTFLF